MTTSPELIQAIVASQLNPEDENLAGIVRDLQDRNRKGEWVLNAHIRMHTDEGEVVRVIVEPFNGGTFYNDSPEDGDYFNQDEINDALGRYLDKVGTQRTTHCECGDELQPCGEHVEIDPANPCKDCETARAQPFTYGLEWQG